MSGFWVSIILIQFPIRTLLFDDEHIHPQLQHVKQLVNAQLLKWLHFPLNFGHTLRFDLEGEPDQDIQNKISKYWASLINQSIWPSLSTQLSIS